MSNTRYIRQMALPQMGSAGQQRLAEARVLVVGAGGLGCPVLQYLVAAGVGQITIADGDLVSESNLHRQVLYGPTDIGLYKAEVAVLRLTSQNPGVRINAESTHLTQNNILEMVAKHDLVIDCTDNMLARYLINDACVRIGTPFVHGSIHRFEGQVAVFNHRGSATYRCAFPENADKKTTPNCSEAGVLGVLPGVIGCLQSCEAMKVILGLDGILSGKLLVMNLLNNSQMVLDVQRSEAQIQIATEGDLNKRNSSVCAVSGVATIGGDELTKMFRSATTPVLVDVRQASERPHVTRWPNIRIPLNEIEERMDELPTDRPIVLFCKSGARSNSAAGVLINAGLGRIYSLSIGAEQLEQLDTPKTEIAY